MLHYIALHCIALQVKRAFHAGARRDHPDKVGPRDDVVHTDCLLQPLRSNGHPGKMAGRRRESVEAATERFRAAREARSSSFDTSYARAPSFARARARQSLCFAWCLPSSLA